MIKLTQDQLDDLAELRGSDGARALIVEIHNQVEMLERDVLAMALTSTNEHELVHRKLKAEGARKIYMDLVKILTKEKKKNEPKPTDSRAT